MTFRLSRHQMLIIPYLNGMDGLISTEHVGSN